MIKRERDRIYRENHKEERRILHREWQRNNRDKVRAYCKRQREKNPISQKRISKTNAPAMNRWRHSHPWNVVMRSVVSRMMTRGKLSKKSMSCQYVGCSPGFLRNHLESFFKTGMTWDNYGEVWHVDHIVPLSWWDVHNHPEHICIASHWTNLQPMFGKENMLKGNKYAA
jgi:hypothetical protein